MSDPKYNFQYCQKIVLFSADKQKLLLAKRKGEADYDGVFSFIGGKMEVTDKNFLEGLKREKDEEIGADTKVKVFPASTHNTLFAKKDGNRMVLPYYLAYFIGGQIKLNVQEYSEYKWVPINEFESFEPKIAGDTAVVNWALDLAKNVSDEDLVEI